LLEATQNTDGFLRCEAPVGIGHVGPFICTSPRGHLNRHHASVDVRWGDVDNAEDGFGLSSPSVADTVAAGASGLPGFRPAEVRPAPTAALDVAALLDAVGDLAKALGLAAYDSGG
jgi:hypothetical protein